MSSKLTKTIFIIVFVVFLGIFKSENVRAESYFAQCYYSDGSVDAVVGIQYNFSFARTVYRSDTALNTYNDIQNWSPTSLAARATGYSGYEDSWQNNKCPDYLVIARSKQAYFSDSANVDKIIEWGKANVSRYSTWLSLPLVGHTYPESDTTKYIEYMRCNCQSGEDSLTYSIAEDGVLTTPSISGNTASRNSGYWYTYGLPYVSSGNQCPQYLLKNGSSYYFASTNDLETVKNKIGGSPIEMTCTVASDTPTQTRVPKPEYNPPTVNTSTIGTLVPSTLTYSCGSGYITDIPSAILRVIRIVYIILQILVPIALVILGSIDLVKAIGSQKDDEIKKGQKTFIKRLITAAIIFFVFAIVKLVVGVFSNDDNEIISCMNCFLDGVENCE